ncbi:hypothetical protein [Rhizobacter sp. Root1221]|uniref:hypothetical protein n=1 Tax=Rhizobacter sp. Root1221 TaxID=1736433 RepID=UPI0006FB9F8B|nr:hypothetical protein [Rhizobacter sp. Root1221]KQV85453.1 hypothetical protein ASC87_07115 [Rhizobacter sp. Root1221]
MGNSIGGTIGLLLFVLGVVLLVTWIVLPFIMIKMNGRVLKQLEEQQMTNHLLTELLAAHRASK